MRYISMAALALMGAITAGCSSDDSIEQQLEKGGAVWESPLMSAASLAGVFR